MSGQPSPALTAASPLGDPTHRCDLTTAPMPPAKCFSWLKHLELSSDRRTQFMICLHASVWSWAESTCLYWPSRQAPCGLQSGAVIGSPNISSHQPQKALHLRWAIMGGWSRLPCAWNNSISIVVHLHQMSLTQPLDHSWASAPLHWTARGRPQSAADGVCLQTCECRWWLHRQR